jgi:hypothetical protein
MRCTMGKANAFRASTATLKESTRDAARALVDAPPGQGFSLLRGKGYVPSRAEQYEVRERGTEGILDAASAGCSPLV